MNVFGKHIKHERQLMDMTEDELAEKSGIDKQTLTLLEEGLKFPDIRYLMKIAKAFGKHPGYFLEDIVYKK